MVFPNTRHRLCQWHISKNVNTNISSLYREPGFRDMFSYLLYNCDCENDFEEKWTEMMVTWDCLNVSWLQKLYNLREKWAPAFSRDTFSCNISSSQRSESTNNVFQHMACKTMILTEFVHHFEQNAEKMHEIEVIDNYNCAHGKPRVLVCDSGILKHACKVYTHKIFGLFQDEFLQCVSQKEVQSSHDNTIHMYKIRKEGGD